MDNRISISLAAAGTALAATACAWALMQRQQQPAVAQAPVAVIEHCKRAAELLYDVNWAAACFRADAENDCTLPDADAAKVNAILSAEESRCMAAEFQASAQQ